MSSTFYSSSSATPDQGRDVCYQRSHAMAAQPARIHSRRDEQTNKLPRVCILTAASDVRYLQSRKWLFPW